MNINVSIDCTPEEARRLMGLPDMAPLHDIYMAKMRDAMTDGITPEAVEKMVRAWSPMGEAGLSAWRQIVDQFASAGNPAKS